MFKRLIKAVMPVLLAFSMVIAPFTSNVNADGSPRLAKYSKNVTVICFNDNCNPYYELELGKLASGAKRISAVSSKKGILKEIEGEESAVFFKVNKPGQTVLSIKIKKKSGVTKKYKVNVTALKYTSPFKSLKIGGKSYPTKTLAKKLSGKFKVKGKSAKFSIKPKTGWAVTDVYYTAEYCGEEENVDGIDKSYKNNRTIKFKKNKDYIENVIITMKYKATGDTVEYWLELDN